LEKECKFDLMYMMMHQGKQAEKI